MRLPLALNLSSRDGTLARDGHLLNAYVEGTHMVSRPGATDLGSAGSGVAQGMSELRATGAAVIGDSLHLFTVSGDTVSVDSTGSLSPITADLSISMQESAETQTTELLLKSNEQGWVYTL